MDVKSHGSIACKIKKSILTHLFCLLIVSDNKSNRAEFIRISPNASVMQVKELLNRQWCREVSLLIFQQKKNEIFHLII